MNLGVSAYGIPYTLPAWSGQLSCLPVLLALPSARLLQPSSAPVRGLVSALPVGLWITESGVAGGRVVELLIVTQ